MENVTVWRNLQSGTCRYAAPDKRDMFTAAEALVVASTAWPAPDHREARDVELAATESRAFSLAMLASRISPASIDLTCEESSRRSLVEKRLDIRFMLPVEPSGGARRSATSRSYSALTRFSFSDPSWMRIESSCALSEATSACSFFISCARGELRASSGTDRLGFAGSSSAPRGL